MVATDSKRIYTATGNVVACDVHDVKMVFRSDSEAEIFATRMNKAVDRYFDLKNNDL